MKAEHGSRFWANLCIGSLQYPFKVDHSTILNNLRILYAQDLSWAMWYCTPFLACVPNICNTVSVAFTFQHGFRYYFQHSLSAHSFPHHSWQSKDSPNIVPSISQVCQRMYLNCFLFGQIALCQEKQALKKGEEEADWSAHPRHGCKINHDHPSVSHHLPTFAIGW